MYGSYAHAEYFMYSVLHSSPILSCKSAAAPVFLIRMENSVDFDQMPSDLDLHCFQIRIYPGSAVKDIQPMLADLLNIPIFIPPFILQSSITGLALHYTDLSVPYFIHISL